MIFVTVGTFNMQFERLLNEIESLNLEDEVIIQSGYNEFTSNKYIVKKFMEKDEFKNNLIKADIVICHGGVGSILEALSLDKKIIAIPRLSKYNEHVDDHQIEIINKFTKDKYILSSTNEKEISILIDKIKEFNPYKYYSLRDNFIAQLSKYIDNI